LSANWSASPCAVIWRSVFSGPVAPDLQRAGGHEDQVERAVERAQLRRDRGLVGHVEPVARPRQPGDGDAACRKRTRHRRSDPARGTDHQSRLHADLH
jgi:hypothetical protein